jgi:galactokinase
LETDLGRLYPGLPEYAALGRLRVASDGFARTFGYAPHRLFSAPGRTELGGNHTDHQRGLVLAAAVDLDDIAAAEPNGAGVIRIFSETFGFIEVNTDSLAPRAEEVGTPVALVRGVADFFSRKGYALSGGFDAWVSGRVPIGSGLSSSAAFEVLIAAVMNGLFFGGTISPEYLAQVGRYAENTHFGKPCGLMDQMASAAGGVVGIDFLDPDSPKLTRLSLDFSDFGYALCIIDTGAKHDGLVDDYAAIPAEMTAVARILNADKLRDIEPGRFFDALPSLRGTVADRALLRAIHYFDENARVLSEISALEQGDMKSFLSLVRESGDSSWRLLQNIYPGAAVSHQPAALVLAWCRRLLGSDGACRIHGGGFGGTIQAFVPESAAPRFAEEMERLTGAGTCRFLKLRQAGAVEIAEPICDKLIKG